MMWEFSSVVGEEEGLGFGLGLTGMPQALEGGCCSILGSITVAAWMVILVVRPGDVARKDLTVDFSTKEEWKGSWK